MVNKTFQYYKAFLIHSIEFTFIGKGNVLLGLGGDKHVRPFGMTHPLLSLDGRDRVLRTPFGTINNTRPELWNRSQRGCNTVITQFQALPDHAPTLDQ